MFKWLKELFGFKTEEKVEGFLPLSFKVGDFVNVDRLDYRVDNLRVKSIDLNSRGSESLAFTDYNLVGDDSNLLTKLRCFKDEEDFSLLILERIESFSYAKEFHDMLKDEVLNHNEQAFTRPSGVTEPAKFSLNKKTKSYWDYYGRYDNIDWVLWVEMDDETGWFEVYKGYPLSKGDVY